MIQAQATVGKAQFIYCPLDADDLRHGRIHDYCIVGTIGLPPKEYREFAANLAKSQPWIAMARNQMAKVDGVYHCILVTSTRHRYHGMLIMSDGTDWPVYVAEV
jgi:hypothetical protein